MIEAAQVTEQLYGVFDPELGLNVVDLGLIYDIKIEGTAVEVTMTLTTQGCPLHDSISRSVEQAVMRLPGVERVSVNLVWEPAWTPERMTAAGRKRLGW